MKELTKQQKIKVIDRMIVLLDQGRPVGLCSTYKLACRLLKYKMPHNTSSLTRRFKELNEAIKSELKRTSGGVIIHYDNWTEDRIDLLKKVKKQL